MHFGAIFLDKQQQVLGAGTPSLSPGFRLHWYVMGVVRIWLRAATGLAVEGIRFDCCRLYGVVALSS